jgi:hypothetical protein
MPLGPDRCNGPSGYMYSTIPPPALMRAEGSISNYISYYIHVNFHIYISTVTHLTFCSKNYCIRIGCSFDCQYSLDIILWCGLQVDKKDIFIEGCSDFLDLF